MPEIALQELEIPVRIVLSTGALLDATIFPLLSHLNDSPIDHLDGFLNHRRGEFFVVRLADGAEQLLPLSQCTEVNLAADAEDLLVRVHPDMRRTPLSADPETAVSYAPVVVTLASGRLVRGNVWFHRHDPEIDRNVAAWANRDVRYLMLHSDAATHFVRRDAVLRVALQSDRDAASGNAASEHACPACARERSGLVNSDEYRTAAPCAHAAPEQPRAPLSATPREFPYTPRSGSRAVPKLVEAAPGVDREGIDEKYWY